MLGKYLFMWSATLLLSFNVRAEQQLITLPYDREIWQLQSNMLSLDICAYAAQHGAFDANYHNNDWIDGFFVRACYEPTSYYNDNYDSYLEKTQRIKPDSMKKLQEGAYLGQLLLIKSMLQQLPESQAQPFIQLNGRYENLTNVQLANVLCTKLHELKNSDEQFNKKLTCRLGSAENS